MERFSGVSGPTQRIAVEELPETREAHLTEAELIELESRTVERSVEVVLRDHLDRCAECKERLETLHQEDSTGKTRIRDPLIGRPLGEYIVEAALARGGMGVVYRGVQPMIGKPVAIKVLLPEFDDADAINRLLDEARAVNAIRHPNIIDIFSFGALPDGRHYFVMQLLDGQSLEELIEGRRQLTVEQVMDVLEQTMSALGAAHAAGVIHRDLKPANLFVSVLPDRSWHLTVLDFGLAKRIGNKRKTMTNVVMGTPGFMAPEQIRGRRVGPPCDLYSMGVVAWVLLTGEEPFQGGSLLDLLHAHLSDPLPALGPLVPPGTPPALIALVEKLLEKSPDARPQSALDVLTELQRIRKGRGPGAQALLTRNPARSGGGHIPAGMPTGELNDALAGTRVRSAPEAPAGPVPKPRTAPPKSARDDETETSRPPPSSNADAQTGRSAPATNPEGAQTTEERPVLVGPRPAPPTGQTVQQLAPARGTKPLLLGGIAVGALAVSGVGYLLTRPPPIDPPTTPAPAPSATGPVAPQPVQPPPPIAEVATAPPDPSVDAGPTPEPVVVRPPPEGTNQPARPKRPDAPAPDRRKWLTTRLTQLEKRFAQELSRGTPVELEIAEVKALRQRLGGGLSERELDAVEAAVRRLERWQP